MQKSAAKAVILFLFVAVSACGGGGASVSPGQNAAVATMQQGRMAAPLTLAPASSSAVIAINAGGDAVGGWVADNGYAAGATATVSNSIDTSRVSNPAPQAVYQSQRYAGNLVYAIPNLVAYRVYSVQVHFVESYWTSSGKRIFNASINGSQVLSNFDIFQSAGGANTAIVRSFNANADENGNLTIQFVASRDYASVAAIAVVNGSGSATPAPVPTAGPGGNTMPWVYSELWSSSSPFRTTVSSLKSRGAQAVSHAYMDSLWSQGIAGNGMAGGIPVYVAKPSDPLLTTTCTRYGGNCNASNVRIHVPSYVKPQGIADAHITVIDQNAPSGPIEIDCWQSSLYGSTFSCSWAGMYQLGGTGLPDGGEGIHGGMAVSTVYTTAQELVNGHIDHALGLVVNCLNNPSVYPANTLTGTDQACNGSSNPPHYGNLVHLQWSSGQIQNSSYSAPCKVVLTALATYGAYLEDTGNNGLQINTVGDLSYTQNPATAGANPWPAIQSKINSAGDGFSDRWYSCLQRLRSSDFELLQVAH